MGYKSWTLGILAKGNIGKESLVYNMKPSGTSQGYCVNKFSKGINEDYTEITIKSVKKLIVKRLKML